MRLVISGILTLVILIMISVFKREVNTLETDGKATVASLKIPFLRK